MRAGTGLSKHGVGVETLFCLGFWDRGRACAKGGVGGNPLPRLSHACIVPGLWFAGWKTKRNALHCIMMGWAHMALPTHSSVARPLGGPNFSAVSSHRISIARSTFYKMRATSVAFNDGLLWKPGGPQRTSSGPLWGSRGPTVKFTNANFTRHQISPPPPPMFYVPHIYTPPPTSSTRWGLPLPCQTARI